MPASLGSIAKEVLEPPTVELEASAQAEGEETTPHALVDVEAMEVVVAKEVEVVPPALMEVEVVEMTLVIVLPILSLIAIKEVQVAELQALALLAMTTIVEVAKEEEPIMVGLPVIEAWLKFSQSPLVY